MAELATTLDTAGVYIGKGAVLGRLPTETITHLAVGNGVVTSGGAIVPPASNAVGLQNEVGRTLHNQRKFVVEQAGGPIVVGAQAYAESATPTNLIYFLFRFLAAEAQANWSEFLFYADGVEFIARGATLHDADGNAGDDLANFQIILGGGYVNAASQTVSVTCTKAGHGNPGDPGGRAEISWNSPGDIGSGGPTAIDWNVPVAIGGGVTLLFDGLDPGASNPTDKALTLDDKWEIRCTRDPITQVFASGGVYDAATNEAGQVKVDGAPIRMHHVDPPFVKGAAIVDIKVVMEVLNL